MTDYRWTYHIYYRTHIQTNDRLQMDIGAENNKMTKVCHNYSMRNKGLGEDTMQF